MQINKTTQMNLLAIKIVSLICLSGFINVQAQQVFEEKTSSIEVSYLESRDELKDYILDTGDTLKIEFINAPELSDSFTIDEQGEIYFRRIKKAYVRGLTIGELTTLLEKRYSDFLIDPEIYIRITTFKPIRVVMKGELRKPGIIKFSAFIISLQKDLNKSEVENILDKDKSQQVLANSIKQIDSSEIAGTEIKSQSLSTISNAIKLSGGLTSYSDLSKIEIIRDIPISKGGGKKKAVIDLTSFLQNSKSEQDIRLFDGDIIYIPKLRERDPNIVRLSILSSLTPSFINVKISGQIENPGNVIIPIEGTLSDVMNLSGPRLPLSGKIFLIRYNKDGTLLRKNIKYSSTAAPGSSSNPYLLSDDLITVKNSTLGRTSSTIKAITDPFIGVYATKEMLESLAK